MAGCSNDEPWAPPPPPLPPLRIRLRARAMTLPFGAPLDIALSLQPVREIIKPENQLKLTEAELEEEIAKMLTANNPAAPKNIARFNMKERTYKVRVRACCVPSSGQPWLADSVRTSAGWMGASALCARVGAQRVGTAAPRHEGHVRLHRQRPCPCGAAASTHAVRAHGGADHRALRDRRVAAAQGQRGGQAPARHGEDGAGGDAALPGRGRQGAPRQARRRGRAGRLAAAAQPVQLQRARRADAQLPAARPRDLHRAAADRHHLWCVRARAAAPRRGPPPFGFLCRFPASSRAVRRTAANTPPRASLLLAPLPRRLVHAVGHLRRVHPRPRAPEV